VRAATIAAVPRRPPRRATAAALVSLGVALVSGLLVAGPAGSTATPATPATTAATGPSVPAVPGAPATLPPLAVPLAPPRGPAAVSGPIRSPGGPYLYDRLGRIVFFHGVNAVYKKPPYELFPAPGKAWNFSAADAALMARLGFNVVRLGMTWSGLEPGTAPANDPAICARGTPGDPHQFNQAVFDRYVARLRTTVDLLGRYHIYTILDMHQDVYNEVWGMVARAFHANPWVLGYDPFNEPFSKDLVTLGDEHFDAQLECFYTGSAHVGSALHGAPPLTCPPGVPANGVVPTILANDPIHLIFDEPDNYASRGFPTFVGPMNFPNLVFNVHVYCGARSPVTGNPTDLTRCAEQDARSLVRRSEDRPDMASPVQPNGPAWFVSEFGATSDPALVSYLTAQMDAEQVGWTFWSWKYYGDPTGSLDEALVSAGGRLRPTALVLSRAYPQAVAGVPISYGFAPGSGVFHLAYVPNRSVHAPTVVFVPTALHYGSGYCAVVHGGRVTSRPGAEELTLEPLARGHRVTLTLRPGSCPPR
jgi:endoglycosylceramidase